MQTRAHNKLGWGNEKEKRLRRLGLVIGLLLALIFHGLIFFGPRISYSPALEKAKIRKVLVARPYRPRPQVEEAPAAVENPVPQKSKPKPADAGGGGEIKGSEPDTPKEVKPVETVKEITSEQPTTDVAIESAGQMDAVDTGVINDPTAVDNQPVAPSVPDESATEEDDWDKMLAMLEEQQGELAARQEKLREERARLDEEEVERQKKEEEVVDEVLDPRIRISVTAYPQSAIETTYTPILYPDIEVRQSNLKAGICRVYYRIWHNARGEIVRTELKAPREKEEREKYSIFIDAVKRSVEEWRLPYVEGQVHIDVRFTIE